LQGVGPSCYSKWTSRGNKSRAREKHSGQCG
jgi:hypothetical protein